MIKKQNFDTSAFHIPKVCVFYGSLEKFTPYLKEEAEEEEKLIWRLIAMNMCIFAPFAKMS